MSSEYTNPALCQQLFCETWFVLFPCTCVVTWVRYWNTSQHNLSREIMMIRWSGLLECQIISYFKLTFVCLFVCYKWCFWSVLVIDVRMQLYSWCICVGAIFMCSVCSVKYLFSSRLLHPRSWRKLSGKAQTIFRAVLDTVLVLVYLKRAFAKIEQVSSADWPGRGWCFAVFDELSVCWIKEILTSHLMEYCLRTGALGVYLSAWASFWLLLGKGHSSLKKLFRFLEWCPVFQWELPR